MHIKDESSPPLVAVEECSFAKLVVNGDVIIAGGFDGDEWQYSDKFIPELVLALLGEDGGSC